MKRRRFHAVNMGRFMLGGLLLAGGGLWVTPAGAQSAAPQTPQQAQLRQILEKLDQVLAATKAGESAKSNVAEDNGSRQRHQDEHDQRIGRENGDAPILVIAEAHFAVGEELMMVERMALIHGAQTLYGNGPMHDVFVRRPFEDVGEQERERNGQ